MAIANVALTDTFDTWRTRTNQLIVNQDQNNGLIAASFAAANVANSNFTASNILSRLLTVDGAGSGLDADLLDGANSSSFLRSDVDDSYNGGVIRFYSQNVDIDYVPATQANGLQIYQSISSNDAIMSFYITGTYGVHFGLDGQTNDLSVGGWSMGNNKYKIWHQGNDGAGSGLDADLLDGQHGSYYSPLTTAQAAQTTAVAAFGKANTACTSADTAQTTAVAAFARANSSLLSSSYTASDVLSKLTTVDGAGSGLDADLLDGQQGTYYQPAASAITTTNIGSQSVNYAASAGNADTVDGYHASSFARYATAAQFTGRVTGIAQSSGDVGVIGYSVGTSYYGYIGYDSYSFYGNSTMYSGGQILCATNITAYYSDKRLKTNITPISKPLELLSQINGVYFTENDLAKSFGYDNDEVQIGVLAQEVQKVVPNAVTLAPFDIEMIDGKATSKSGENYLTVKYEKLVPLLIEAVKELKNEVDELRSKLENK